MDRHSGKLENQSFNLSWTGFTFSKTTASPLSPASATMENKELEIARMMEKTSAYVLILVVWTVKTVSSKSAKISDNEIM